MFKIKNNVFYLKRILNIKFNKNIFENSTNTNTNKLYGVNTNNPFNNTSSFNKLTKFNFCLDEKDNKNIKRYEYDYEAPEDSNFEYKSKIKRFLNLLSALFLFSYCFYYFFLQKLNILTKKRELYLINEFFEVKLNNYFSNKIQKIFENYIFNHDNKDIDFVLKVYKRILQKNKIPFRNIDKYKIFIIQSETLGCFILKNGDIFISNRLIDFCKKNENYLSFFISSELAFLAMELNTKRIFEIWLHKKKEKSKHLKKTFYETDDLPSFSLMDKKQKQLEYFNRFLLYYPESIVSNYFLEKEVMKIALKLLVKSEYDILEVKIFFYFLGN